MSELSFYFHAPTPRYFRDNGLFKNYKNKAFVDWCFERCCEDERVIFHDNQKITLKPYQFIFGRTICCEETGLSDNEVRTQQQRWENCNFLKKTTNKTPNRFTIYEWVMTCFCKDYNQQNNQQTTNRPPTDHHNQEDKKIRYKEDHHPDPSSKSSLVGEVELIDDFLSKKDSNSKCIVIPKTPFLQHNLQNQTTPKIEDASPSKVEVYKGVFLTQTQLDECILARGSLETVELILHQAHHCWVGRQKQIKDWPKTIKNWTIQNTVKHQSQENEELAKTLEETYAEDIQNKTLRWTCKRYNDKNKGSVGLLFSANYSSADALPIFVSFTDGEFKEKVHKVLRDKKMQKGRISKT